MYVHFNRPSSRDNDVQSINGAVQALGQHLKEKMNLDGNKYTLQANYFVINLENPKELVWKRYYVQVHLTGNTDDVPKGFKLRQIITQALSTMGIATNMYATDFKSQVIVMAVPKKTTCKEQFTNESGLAKSYDVKLTGGDNMSFGQIGSFLGSQALPTEGANPYTCFSDVLDAAGIVLGHAARSNSGVNSLRSGRYFQFNPVPNDHQHYLVPAHYRQDLPTHLMLIRGYFQSVRPATAVKYNPPSLKPSVSPTLLLNTNVAYGVFRRALRLDEVIRPPNNHHASRFLEEVNRQLAKAKIVYSAPILGSATSKELNKVMIGLADSRRSGGGTNPPRFLSNNARFGNAKQVSFFLNGQGNLSNALRAWYNQNTNNRWITVYDYFNKRRSLPNCLLSVVCVPH